MIWQLFAYRRRGRRIDPGPAIPSADRAAGILPLAKVRWRRAARWRRLARRGAGRAIMAEVLQRHVFARPDFAMGGPHGGAPRGPIAGGLHGGGAPHFAMGGPHGGGGPHGTPLRLGTRSRHGRPAPRGAPLHGGRQRQIRGSVPSHGARVLEVRIRLPPALSPQRTMDAGLVTPRSGEGGETDLPAVIA